MFCTKTSAFQRTAGGKRSSFLCIVLIWCFSLFLESVPSQERRDFSDGFSPTSMIDLSTSLKKVMHPILGKAPQLSWEAKKAGLSHCQRCVFSSLHWSLPGQSQHKWNTLQAALVALSLFLLLELSGLLAACGTPGADGTFTARTVQTFCCACSAQLQGSALFQRGAWVFMLELSWCLSLLQVFIVTNAPNTYYGYFCLIHEHNCKLLM